MERRKAECQDLVHYCGKAVDIAIFELALCGKTKPKALTTEDTKELQNVAIGKN